MLHDIPYILIKFHKKSKTFQTVTLRLNLYILSNGNMVHINVLKN